MPDCKTEGLWLFEEMYVSFATVTWQRCGLLLCPPLPPNPLPPHPPHKNCPIVKDKTVECFGTLSFCSGLFVKESLPGTNKLQHRHADTAARDMQKMFWSHKIYRKYTTLLSRHRWGGHHMNGHGVAWFLQKW